MSSIQSSSLTVFNRENAHLSDFDASLGKEVDLQPRTEDKPTPGTAGKDLTELLTWAERPRARSL